MGGGERERRKEEGERERGGEKMEQEEERERKDGRRERGERVVGVGVVAVRWWPWWWRVMGSCVFFFIYLELFFIYFIHIVFLELFLFLYYCNIIYENFIFKKLNNPNRVDVS